MTRQRYRRGGIAVALLGLAGCGTSMPELQPVEHVDLPRFMGRWYVIANIPTFLEKGAWNAVESYALADDGSIATTFTYRKGGPHGKRKQYTPRGFVRDRESNAVWGMRFVWPFRADYRVIWLAPDYSLTVIGRNKRDYVWVMAREPRIDDDSYARLVAFIAESGYDTSKLQRVPQEWP